MSSKKILITGAEGFIGKSILENLLITEQKESTGGGQKYTVYAPKKDELDLLDTEKVEEYIRNGNFDTIIHTANYGRKDAPSPDQYLVLKNGLKMFFNIERCSEYFGKMIYFGSGAEYDVRHYTPFMREEHFGQHIPDDPYGFYKYTLAQYTSNVDRVYDLRLFGVVGKYEQVYRFISNNICRALKGLPISVNQHCFFDYISVNDLSTILMWFIENEPKYKHYNVCRGEHIDLCELADMIREEFDNKPDVVLKNSGWKNEYSGDNSRLRSELGNDIKFTPYSEIIRELISYYTDIIDDVDVNIL